jgi:hypothetical protein
LGVFSFKKISKNPSKVLRLLPAFIVLVGALLPGMLEGADTPDTLTLADGEIFIGKLVRSNKDSLTFHSDGAGDITVPWAKVKEFSSSRAFAVVPKGVELKAKQADGSVRRGAIHVTDQQIQITPAAGQPLQTVPTEGAAFIVDEDAYQKALHNANFFEGWNGAVTGGVSLVTATQRSETFTSAVHLVRAIPNEDWLAARNRTLFNFVASYGKVHQPNIPDVKTDLIHFDGERDEYFSPRVYALETGAYDHNFSLGLTLQQTYGGGLGWTAVKSAKQTLDLKASGSYISQRFTDSTTKNLIGSIFGETYHRNLFAGIKFDEQITVIPAWNNTNALSANGGAGITIPLSKGLGFNLSTLDTFLNDPPAGFKKNSFQFTTGVTYSLP